MIHIKLKASTKKMGAVVVIVDNEDNVLLLKRPTWITWGAGKWAFPGGKMEVGETPLQAAMRETKEETQLEVHDLRLVKVCEDSPVMAYYTRNYGGNVQIDWEHDDWAWVAHDELSSYDLAPQVLEMYEWVLKNG